MLHSWLLRTALLRLDSCFLLLLFLQSWFWLLLGHYRKFRASVRLSSRCRLHSCKQAIHELVCLEFHSLLHPSRSFAAIHNFSNCRRTPQHDLYCLPRWPRLHDGLGFHSPTQSQRKTMLGRLLRGHWGPSWAVLVEIRGTSQDCIDVLAGGNTARDTSKLQVHK